MARNRWETVAWAAAAVTAVEGCIVLIVGLLTPVSFGWFAYQPLADRAFAPAGSGVFVSRVTIIGSVLVATGCVGLAFLAGWRASASRRP